MIRFIIDKNYKKVKDMNLLNIKMIRYDQSIKISYKDSEVQI